MTVSHRQTAILCQHQSQREMGNASEQIRVSDTVKRELDRRRREGESYNDILERVLDDDRDLLVGHGLLTDQEGDQLREQRHGYKQTSTEQMQRLVDDG